MALNQLSDQPLRQLSLLGDRENPSMFVEIVTNKDGQSQNLDLSYDPPNGTSTPTALGLCAHSIMENAIIFWTEDGGPGKEAKDPTLKSKYVTRAAPYIQLDTPYGFRRERFVKLIALDFDITSSKFWVSKQLYLRFIVEADTRRSAYAFFVPGVESGGYFVGIGIEMNATARAQTSGAQEFSDFTTTPLKLGTYPGQVHPLSLTDIPTQSDLRGFQGGFTVNTTNQRYYGVLIPSNNDDGNFQGRMQDRGGFFGRVVRVDLRGMISNLTNCSLSYRIEAYAYVQDPNGTIHAADLQVSPRYIVNATHHPPHTYTGFYRRVLQVTGPSLPDDACVHILDLESLHRDARGFRQGFAQHPYGFLSPGEFSVPVRLDMEHFGLDTTVALDLGEVGPQFGGYSGGFADGGWACFNPYRTYFGPVGGLRSKLPVDAGHLRPFFHSLVTCVHEQGWARNGSLAASVRTLDTSNLEPGLRGFSSAVRVGRYAYMAPMTSEAFTFTCKLVRLYLGDTDIAERIDWIRAHNASVGVMMSVLDLSQKDPRLCGFSQVFSSGQYLFLSPFKNAYEPRNGQRGHGVFARVDMNDFSLNGISFLDLPVTTRNQIPSFADVDLRGFSGGFSTGKYVMLVPWFNGLFSGKVARLQGTAADAGLDLQEVDLCLDRARGQIYKAYTGGFTSLWQANFF